MISPEPEIQFPKKTDEESGYSLNRGFTIRLFYGGQFISIQNSGVRMSHGLD